MVKNIAEIPPCTGPIEGEGCSNFEDFFSRERFAIHGTAEAGVADARVALLDDADLLRTSLHREFVAAGYCRLSQIDIGSGVDKAVRIRRPDGCEVALGVAENTRLFSPDTMYYLLRGSLRPVIMPDGIITQCFDKDDAAFDIRLRRHREILVDEDKDVGDRLVSAGSLLFNFYDVDSLSLTEELLDSRMTALIEDPVLRDEVHLEGRLSEWIAWRKILVALSFYGGLTEDVVEKFFLATLLDKASDTDEHAEDALENSYHTIVDLLKKEAGSNRNPNSRKMQKAATNTAELLVSVFARVRDRQPEEVVSKFRRPRRNSNTIRHAGQLTLGI